MMTKEDFIALADAIGPVAGLDDSAVLSALADFCAEQNPRFNRERWLGYIRGECGPNGGAIRKPKGGAS
jgi:hypothetical protein